MKDSTLPNFIHCFASCVMLVCVTVVSAQTVVTPAPFWDQYVQENESPVIHLNELATIVANMPSAKQPKVIIRGQAEESYIREGITLGALFVIMISGHVFGKRREGETVIMQKVYTAHEEAKIILALGHIEARLAIDSLQGEHKVKVLRAIAGNTIQDEPVELPFVQVERQAVPVLQS